MMEWFIRIVLAVMGILTAFPVLSLFNPADLTSRYGVTNLDPVTEILLRHRGMLQLLVGASLVWAAFSPAIRFPVILAVIASKLTFVLLVQSAPAAQNTLTASIQRFDLTSITLLVAVAVAEFLRRAGTFPRQG